MTTTKKLKIWTLVTHGLIIIGAGHGILFLFIIEIFSFPYVTKENFSFLFNGVENHFPVVGLLSFLGQATLIFSIIHHKKKLQNVAQIIGLSLLWLSVVYFTYDTTKDAYTHIALVTAIPFVICTIITFVGQLLKRLYNWIIDA
jgi:hypothetical protein